MKVYVQFDNGNKEKFAVDQNQIDINELTACYETLKDDLMTAALLGVNDKAKEIDVKTRYTTGVERILISV